MPPGIGFVISLHRRLESGRGRTFREFTKTFEDREFAARMLQCFSQRQRHGKMRRAGTERYRQELQLASRRYSVHSAGNLRLPFRLGGDEQRRKLMRRPVIGISHPSPRKSGPTGAADFHVEMRWAGQIGFEGKRLLATTPPPERPLERHLARRKTGDQRGLPESAPGNPEARAKLRRTVHSTALIWPWAAMAPSSQRTTRNAQRRLKRRNHQCQMATIKIARLMLISADCSMTTIWDAASRAERCYAPKSPVSMHPETELS